MRITQIVGAMLIVGATAIVGACSVAEAPDSSVEPGVVAVAAGQIAGIQAAADSAVWSWLGVPYAAPPTGDLRWMPPQPVSSWSGIRETKQLPAGCLQGELSVDAGTGPFFGPGATRFDEDCLYLNIWSAASPGDEAPVLVWIHGGGLYVGDGSEVAYNGTSLASRGAVVVTINYRLGPLGYMAHPLLREESDHNSSGNYGLLDQIAALQWVQDNIVPFGGDPSRVTIFGESAGSWSVNYLMATPLATGLFATAIGQSGGAFAPGGTFAMSEAEASGEQLVRALLGSDSNEDEDEEVTLAAMRAAPATDLVAAATGIPRPTVDGWVLPDTVYNIFSGGHQNDVPVIVGANADEGTLSRAIGREVEVSTVGEYEQWARDEYGAMAGEFLTLYPVESDDDVVPRGIDAEGDARFVWEMRTWARLMDTVSSPAYLYLFTRVPPAPDAERFGSYHTAEIPYVFGNLNGGGRFWYANRDYDEIDRQLSDQMSSYWLNFAATGDPNGDGLVEWPAYSLPDEATLELGEVVKVHHGVRKERLDFFDRFYSTQLDLE